MYEYDYKLFTYKHKFCNSNKMLNTLSKDVLNKIYKLQNQETIQQES